MDSPVSAASSATTPSTTSGPIHKRNASVRNGIKPTGSTVVSLFVTNLRLLNLDLLPDWPNIAVSSFSNQDARTKIKCVEYALYQLFRLYDPATTSDKLQPFFPPLEPLQSVNLRAALFRCLNDLKRNGLLGKDNALRKTMLDECQGEKFWETCLNFSTIVLRKCALETRSKRGKPVAQKLGTIGAVSKSQRDSMLPLAIAHKAALTRVLDDRKQKRQTYSRLYDLLVDKEAELRQRKIKSQEQAQRTRKVQPEKLKAVEQAVDKNWIGSSDLKDALIDGDTCPKGDGMLLQPFDKLWRADGDAVSVRSGGAEIGLLQNLNERAAEQNARLRRWQNFHDHLMATKPTSQRSSRPTSGTQRNGFRFDRHRNINLHDSPEEDDEEEEEEQRQPPPKRQRQATSVSCYDNILNAMREELRKNSAHRTRNPPAQQTPQPLKRAQTQPMPLRKPSLAVDTSPGAADPHNRSPSQTAVPVRTPMARRVSSRSRSYQQPKVASQREPIPLKSEIFSPLKEKRRSSVGPGSVSPADQAEEPINKINGIDWATVTSNGKQAGSEPASQRDSGLGIVTKGPLNGIDPNSARTVLPNGNSELLGDAASAEPELKMPLIQAENQQTAGAPARPSLAERTRKSMAFNGMDDIKVTDSESKVVLPSDQDTSQQAAKESEVEESVDRRASLLERTRQSISLAPAPAAAPRSKKSSHNRSRTSIYPVNQFETPKRTGIRRSTINGIEEEPMVHRVGTPVEKLLSPDAEYDSVFKSRPKIAMSPLLTPCRDGEGLAGERSSPLVGVDGRD